MLIIRRSLARQGFKDYISQKLSAASPIYDFPSPMVSSSSYSKRANAIRPYNCANDRVRPKCPLDISTKLRCTQIIPILLPFTQKPEEPEALEVLKKYNNTEQEQASLQMNLGNFYSSEIFHGNDSVVVA